MDDRGGRCAVNDWKGKLADLGTKSSHPTTVRRVEPFAAPVDLVAGESELGELRARLSAYHGAFAVGRLPGEATTAWAQRRRALGRDMGLATARVSSLKKWVHDERERDLPRREVLALELLPRLLEIVERVALDGVEFSDAECDLVEEVNALVTKKSR